MSRCVCAGICMAPAHTCPETSMFVLEQGSRDSSVVEHWMHDRKVTDFLVEAGGEFLAMFTFSPICSRSSKWCVCVWTEWTWSMYYTGIFTYQFIPYYASAIRKHMHTHILKPFEDGELTGLKADIAPPPPPPPPQFLFIQGQLAWDGALNKCLYKTEIK